MPSSAETRILRDARKLIGLQIVSVRYMTYYLYTTLILLPKEFSQAARDLRRG